MLKKVTNSTMTQLRVNGTLSSIIYGQMERAMSTKQREEQREWRILISRYV